MASRCSVCKQVFKMRQSMLRHKRESHGVCPLFCCIEPCEYKTKRKHDKWRHQLRCPVYLEFTKATLASKRRKIVSTVSKPQSSSSSSSSDDGKAQGSSSTSSGHAKGRTSPSPSSSSDPEWMRQISHFARENEMATEPQQTPIQGQ